MVVIPWGFAVKIPAPSRAWPFGPTSELVGRAGEEGKEGRRHARREETMQEQVKGGRTIAGKGGGGERGESGAETRERRLRTRM